MVCPDGLSGSYFSLLLYPFIEISTGSLINKGLYDGVDRYH